MFGAGEAASRAIFFKCCRFTGTFCRYVENKCFLKGVEADILNFLSKHLNFTYTLENYEGRIGGSWTSMINSV